jgi:hypothetical protein
VTKIIRKDNSVNAALPPAQAPVAAAAGAIASAPAATNPLLQRLGEYKEFIIIIVAALSGLWFAVDYFVTRERFAEVMISNQCQLFGNVAKLSQKINENYYRYINDRTVDQLFPYQQKTTHTTDLTVDETRRMKELQGALDLLKKEVDASAERAKIYDDALSTGNCAKLINFAK